MLKEFETAVRQFQQALAQAGIAGDVEVTLPREPMLKLYTEWIEAPVMRFGPHYGFERSVFESPGAGGTWTIRHKRPEMGDVLPPPPDLEAQEAVHAKRMGAYSKASGNPDMLRGPTEKIAEPAAIPIPEESRTAIRDAALEEADKALAADGWGPVSSPRISIRSLMPKPAPDTRPKQSDYCMECEKPKTAHGMSCSQDSAAERERAETEEVLSSGGGFSHVSGKTTQRGPVQCLVPGCDRPHQHEGAHEPVKATPEAERWLRGESHSQPVVHDFGWALAQMRAGKTVTRRKWNGWRLMHTGSAPEPRIITHAPGLLGSPDDSVRSDDVLASDWEVVP